MISTTGRDLMLDALALQAGFVSLHSGPPTDIGLLELSGGTPAYARLPVIWDPSTGGVLAMSGGSLVFNIPAAATTAFAGLWTLDVGGSFLGYCPSSNGGIYGSATASATSLLATCPAHLLINGTAVILSQVAGRPLPTPFQPNTLYYVVSALPDTFQLSATLGGFPLDFTLDGTFAFQRVGLDTFSSQGTLTISSLSFSLEG